ncbi:MAG: phosphatidate cytidylyltransferase [Bacteroidota bacterium]
MSNTATRILVAIAAIPVIVFLILQGSWFFAFFVMIISAVALHEFYNLARAKNISPNAQIGMVAGIGLQATLAASNFGLIPTQFSMMAFIGIIIAFTLAAIALELRRALENPLLNIATTIMGVMYVPVFFACLIQIRQFYSALSYENGAFLKTAPNLPAFPGDSTTLNDWGGTFILLVFVSIWLCDSVAFFVGKSFGNHKLFPRVSPGKSWEGAIAGFISSAVGFPLLAHYFLPGFPLHHAIAIGIITGSISQIGDLSESLLKRDAGIKDSSNYIPGHGGFLDRFDSLLFIAPAVYVYLLIVSYLV